MPTKATNPPNIYLIGAQCTGKTTLLAALQAFFSDPNNRTRSEAGAFDPPAIIPEVVREVMELEGFSASDIKDTRWQILQRLTLEAQCLAEEKLTDQWYISDRSGLDPIIYAQLQETNDAQAMKESASWAASQQRMKNSLVILCEAGNPDWFKLDTARISHSESHNWHNMHTRYITLLEETDIKFFLLEKSITKIGERVNFVIRKFERMYTETDTSA
ncbi:hypothetical protein EJ05DRAFT_526550 [Pseudovirgaria hyperparasitica]|uniref:NadR/Ttd14 AAA domain-containing protein n=1 Tax=Pseudovirgaria hyperparasitica TaxID=470096 RepID=A0A6A6WCS5_9PEZI|nr:uncharacterized protein EJ05DRAFT_526550 [Pseudovirgaria hyperparasitica]KAF2759854.1 hypothetical protein EJ05DRAFT_526550 [Pseudovirgaria hyperparasitica]